MFESMALRRAFRCERQELTGLKKHTMISFVVYDRHPTLLA
jgi:hypothetical protein